MRGGAHILRVLVFVLGGLETVAVMIVFGIVIASGQLFSGEHLSRELAWVSIMVFGVPYLTFVVPAVALAFSNRYLLLALGLCVLSLTVAFFAFIYA